MLVGYSRIEISPDFDCALFGYPGPKRLVGKLKNDVLDPLYSTCIYFEGNRGQKWIWISLDICVLLPDDCRKLRENISEALELKPHQIWISCTHTHSAPFAKIVSDEKLVNRFGGTDSESQIKFGKLVNDSAILSAVQAVNKKEQCKLGFRSTYSGLAYDRRCKIGDSILNCWNLEEFPDRVPEPAKNLSHSVLKLTFSEKPGGIILHSTGIHPVVMGKESSLMSSDWPGHTRKYIESHLPHYQSMFVQGAGAEVQPWISTQKDPHGLHVVGEAIGSEAILLAESASPLEIKDFFQLRQFPIKGTELEGGFCQLGNIAYVALPFEVSTELATLIQKCFSIKVFIASLTQGWNGYWMSPSQFIEGGYEIEVAETLSVSIDDIQNLLATLKKLGEPK